MKRGALTPEGPLCMGDLRRLVRNADALQYRDSALVEITTPMAGDRRRVTLTVTDGAGDPLGDNDIPLPPEPPADHQ